MVRLSLMALVGVLALAGYMVYLDVQLRERLDSRLYQLPARVFARPLILRERMVMRPDELEAEFEALNYRKRDTLTEPGQWTRNGMDYRVWRRDFQHADGREPAAVVSFRLRNDEISNLRDENGERLESFRLDAANIGTLLGGGDDRNPVRFADIPPLLANTLIAVEDQDFLNHFGVSPRGIARAMLANLKAGEVVQGGSTITQQLVKNIFFDHKPSLWRKFNEALMAILMELHYEKGYILQEYINEVWLGQQGSRAIYGFGLASEFYFQRPLDRLEPHQIALLVGLAKGASYYNPWRHPERALERRNTVLDIMLKQGLIDADTHRANKAKPLGVSSAGGNAQNPYPAFTERLLEELRPYYSYEELRTAGLRIYTTLAPSVQKVVEDAVSAGAAKLEQTRGIQKDSLQAATVLLENQSGKVLAMVGDRRPHYPGFNRALEARRQVGSLIKPAVYLTALERPHKYNLATPIEDAPLRVESDDGQVWMPSNFDKRSHGPTPLYLALAKSYNQATARLGMDLGLENVRQTIRRLGVQADLPRVPAMLLGAVELTPFEVANMFQTIANGGEHVEPRTLLAVSDADGGHAQYFRRRADRGVDPVPAYLLRYALEQAMREGTGRSAFRRLPGSVAFAGKTGTTNDYRDSWFAGFSPGVTAVVWLGRDDNARTSLTGATGALSIWTEVMRSLPHRHGRVEPPRGVEFKPVNERGQYMDPDYCRGGTELPFSYETRLQPAPECAGRDRWRWFRNWFDRGDQQEAAPREEMTPGWGIDPSEEERRRERERQLQEQLRRDDESQQDPQPDEEPLQLPRREEDLRNRAAPVVEAQPWQREAPQPWELEDQWP
ncbi:penicillin-binding protein 1B [Microbulbifer thermotolerans]|uniref:penicillin-binding protein 1B n=1 Tax=Microbulbifer thermotolerans TaxID=252514 RepID=UPI00224B41D3|nr:penicillin-binding protein 1B [Microbulbifer thermotolerans]MCX2784179.1 penicillin-binding protein 1B [Microbulbifer thermotolerans]MCX2842773.1 penicillin-binding protein 1B [Microbulbifer thermotolerans]